MMLQMTHMSQQLNGQMLSNQDIFHSEVKGIYTNLATSVDKSLKDSLTQSAQVASDSLKPVIEAAMAGMAKEASVMHARVVDTTQLQLDGLSKRFNDTCTTVSTTWTTALATHQDTSANLLHSLGQGLAGLTNNFEQRANLLLAAANQANVALRAEQAALDQQQQTAWTNSLQSLASTLQHEWAQAGAQTRSQQQEICTSLTQTAQHITAQAQISASTTLAEVTRLMATSEELVRTRVAAEADWTTQHSERMTQVTNLLRDELGALRRQEAAHGQAAVDRLGDLQVALASHLSTLGSALEAPITRLLDTASQAPRAAAEVIGQLRQEMSNSMARDNALLDERSRILATLNTLLEGIHHAAAEQRTVIDTLVNSSAVTLNQAGSQFAEQIGLEATKLSDIAAQVTSSAVEVSSLGETFGFAVHTFTQANEKLMGSLQRIEAAMDKSMGRSDEQLAYYVAQAREIIDLSMLSQKEIFEALRQLPGRPVAATGEVA
jgi:HD-GYP domain-containing protein (c-di-GMP phosphodiesterase class II)